MLRRKTRSCKRDQTSHGSVYNSVAKASADRLSLRRSRCGGRRGVDDRAGRRLEETERICAGWEDQELLAAVIADVLGDSHDVVGAPRFGDAIDHLRGDDIYFVLLDWRAAGRGELAGRSSKPSAGHSAVFMTGDAGQAEELG